MPTETAATLGFNCIDVLDIYLFMDEIFDRLSLSVDEDDNNNASR